MARPRVAIVLRHGLAPGAWRERFDRGDTWDRTPYGYDRAESDFELVWTEDLPERAFGRFWRGLLRRLFGFDFVHVWRNRAILRTVDVVWTHTEREHLAVALLKRLGRHYDFASVAQSVWLWDNWSDHSRVRRAFYASLLRTHDVEVLLSRLNRDVSDQAVPGRVVVHVPFGTQGAELMGRDRHAAGDGTVLAVGNDRHRDWALLADVARQLGDIPFVVSTLSDEVRAKTWPANVTVTTTGSAEEIAQLYAGASVAVIPLIPNLHASGCTVAIEAISAGIPLVVTDAGGIDDYVAGTDAALVPVDDREGFAAAVLAAMASDSGDEIGPNETSTYRTRGLTQADYIERLVVITRAVLASEPVPPRVSWFAPQINPADGQIDT